MPFEQLKSKVKDGSIDTVLVCFVDMQGRLMGKRFHSVNLWKPRLRKPTAVTTC